jgi:hypothetical protein
LNSSLFSSFISSLISSLNSSGEWLKSLDLYRVPNGLNDDERDWYEGVVNTLEKVCQFDVQFDVEECDTYKRVERVDEGVNACVVGNS